MSPGDKAGFPSEILHLDIKTHMTANVLIPYWDRPLIAKDLKGNSDVPRLLANGILLVAV